MEKNVKLLDNPNFLYLKCMKPEPLPKKTYQLSVEKCRKQIKRLTAGHQYVIR